MVNRKMKTILPIVAIFLIAVMVVGCAQTKPSGESPKKSPESSGAGQKQDLAIATSSTGGTGFMYGTAIAKIINEHIPGLSARSIATAGVVENDRLIRAGEADIGIALPMTAYESYVGKGDFAKIFSQVGPYKDIRAMWWMYGTLLQAIVPADSKIKSFADLKGKRVGLGMPGSTAYIGAVGILEAYGVKLDQITSRQMSVDEMASSLKDGTVDAVITIMGVDTPAFKDLANVRQVRWLPVGKEQFEKFASKWPPGFFVYGKIPAGSYKGQNEDVPTVVIPLLLFTTTKLDTETVYKITKAFWENLDEAYQVHPVVKESNLEFSFSASPPIPWHPGTVKYLEEKGIKYGKYQG